MKKQDERFNDDTASNAYTDAAEVSSNAYTDAHRSSRNLLINGDFLIWQRGNSFAAGSSVYTADRWAKTNAVVVSRPTTSTNAIKLVASAYCEIQQLIEVAHTGKPGIFSIGSKFTVSFDAEAIAPISLSGFLFGRDTTGTTNQSNMSNTTTFPVTTTKKRISATFEITQDMNPTNKAMALILAIPSAATVTITNIQLEEGSVATPFDYRPHGLELMLCQRYFQRFIVRSDIVGTEVNTAASGYICYIHSTLLVPMREPPTVSKSEVFRSPSIPADANHAIGQSGNKNYYSYIQKTATELSLNLGSINLITETSFDAEL